VDVAGQENGATPAKRVTVQSSAVRDNVVRTNNRSVEVRLAESVIRGSATISGNITTSASIIAENAIDADLDCVDNTPAPGGASNIVGGVATGQCAGLVAP